MVDNLERRLRNKPSYINKFDLVLKIISFAARVEGRKQSIIFQNLTFKCFQSQGNGGDKESVGNCFLFRTGEGKPPFDNAEANQLRRVAEIFTVRAFMKLNSSRFRSNLTYFSENDCFSHFIQRPVSSK